MLALRRHISESISFGDDWRLTVIGLKSTLVELELCHQDNGTKESFHLPLGDARDLPIPGVTISCIMVMPNADRPFVHLGIVAPTNQPVHRLEVYEAIRRENLPSDPPIA